MGFARQKPSAASFSLLPFARPGSRPDHGLATAADAGPLRSQRLPRGRLCRRQRPCCSPGRCRASPCFILRAPDTTSRPGRLWPDPAQPNARVDSRYYFIGHAGLVTRRMVDTPTLQLSANSCSVAQRSRRRVASFCCSGVRAGVRPHLLSTGRGAVSTLGGARADEIAFDLGKPTQYSPVSSARCWCRCRPTVRPRSGIAPSRPRCARRP